MARATIIISVYKDVENLEIILDGLERQSEKNFEALVSEDGDSQVMKEFILKAQKRYSFPLIHNTQEDLGWRKNRALNSAIRKSTTDYLIFIDGDCVPHFKFIENHIRFGEENTILSGRRVNLGENFSNKMKNEIGFREKIDHFYLKKIISIYRDNEASFVEEGIYIDPTSLLFPLLRSIKRQTTLLGCNMSCHKKTLEIINGFDEDYLNPGGGEDVDIEWRFRKAGCEIKTVKNLAIQYHIHHERGYSIADSMTLLSEKKAKGDFFCKNGLN